ncbi:hypothetical protein [Devriesea agamarum]|uniref:hypothetical protein n=1 Tax=Devriesea agamarum TaxID=472569 RepID=UPI00071C573B|nr:hypothetical protein [Devriesea agamarum]
MNDWRTYMKAARNTVRQQAPGAREAVKQTVKDAAQSARVNAKAAGHVLSSHTEQTRKAVRQDAAAYVVVAHRKLKRAQLGRRLLAALRDALIMGVSITVIWFILSKTAVKIPFEWVLIGIILLMALRFVVAFSRKRPESDEAEATGAEQSPDGSSAPPQR